VGWATYGREEAGVATNVLARRANADASSGRALAGPAGQLTSVSWSAPGALSFEQWVFHGRRLGAIGRGVGWWIADWLRFGNARYGEKYVRASKITGYDVQTLMNMVYVASSVDPSRRRERLSWSHHAEVAALPPEEQDHWLDRVEEHRMSVRDLRLLLREARRGGKTAEPGADPDTLASAEVCPRCGHALEQPIKRRRRGIRRRSGSHPDAADRLAS
jgi:hypothetical protein